MLRRMLDIAIREDILLPQAAYGYWPCAAEGNDVILFAEDGEQRARALLLPAPGQGGRAVHRRFLPRRRATTTRDVIGAPGGDDRPARLRGGAANGSPTTATRTISICTGFRSRWPRPWPNICTSASAAELGFAAEEARDLEGAAAAGLSRQPLFLRLSRLPQPRRPAPAARAAPRRGDRRHPDRGRPARPRAIDLGHRRHPPAGQVLLGLRRARPAASIFTGPDIWPIVPACRRLRTLRPAPPSRS